MFNMSICLTPGFLFFSFKKLIKVYHTFPTTNVFKQQVDNSALGFTTERPGLGREGINTRPLGPEEGTGLCLLLQTDGRYRGCRVV